MANWSGSSKRRKRRTSSSSKPRGRPRPAPAALATALACVAAPATAQAADTGFATGAAAFTNGLQSAAFKTLNAGEHFKYARFFAPWDVAGGADCTSHTGKSLAAVKNAITAAEGAGFIPVVAISKGSDFSGDPAVPTPAEYNCAFIDFLSAFQGVLPAHAYIETWNEPNFGVTAQDASMFYFYARLQDSNWGRTDTLIGGTFSDASSGSVAAGTRSNCSGGGYDWRYVCDMHSLGINPGSWAFHDYHDVEASYGCSATGAAGCVTTEAQNFRSLLSSFGQSTSDIWMTEAGVFLNGGISGSGSSNNELDGTGTAPNGNSYKLNQAQAAEGWKNLAGSGLVAHSFYYELETYGNGHSNSGSDDFDSALIGIANPDYSSSGNLVPSTYWTGQGNTAGNGVPRASYCVLAFDESPSTAVSDQRCNYTGTSPQLPWTDWQGDAIYG
jgi:hypothetical protein